MKKLNTAKAKGDISTNYPGIGLVTLAGIIVRVRSWVRVFFLLLLRAINNLPCVNWNTSEIDPKNVVYTRSYLRLTGQNKTPETAFVTELKWSLRIVFQIQGFFVHECAEAVVLPCPWESLRKGALPCQIHLRWHQPTFWLLTLPGILNEVSSWNPFPHSSERVRGLCQALGAGYGPFVLGAVCGTVCHAWFSFIQLYSSWAQKYVLYT